MSRSPAQLGMKGSLAHAEAHRILSAAQSGFRQRTSHAAPIQMLQMIIEDAELSQQDLYTLQVDFSSAFNTIDQ
jgi:hypothetical protein